MKFHKQRVPHDPQSARIGDCEAICIACLLDLEADEVPDFADPAIHHGRPELAWKAERDWLALRDLTMVYTAYPGSMSVAEVRVGVSHLNPGLPFLFSGRTADRLVHTVIVRDGDVVHDPASDVRPIIGPMPDGFFWCSFLAKNLVEARDAAA